MSNDNKADFRICMEWSALADESSKKHGSRAVGITKLRRAAPQAHERFLASYQRLTREQQSEVDNRMRGRDHMGVALPQEQPV